MLTSGGMHGDAARCLKLGISAYLTKPIDQKELLNAIKLTFVSSKKGVKQPELITRYSLRENRRALKILIAEDNVINQRIAAHILEKNGHQVVIASNGQKAINAWGNSSFDAIFMDIQLPRMDGIEATAYIRKKEKKSGLHTPIIAMTAHAMKGDRERFLAAGMDDYISKPIKAEEMIGIIEGTLSNIKKEQQPLL